MHRFALLVLILLFFSPAAGYGRTAAAAAPEGVPATSERVEQSDLEWFRDQLHIAPKYQEQEEGILGMSWLHFMTMVFLFLFFLAAMIVYALHARRKQEIIDTLLSEEEGEGEKKGGP